MKLSCNRYRVCLSWLAVDSCIVNSYCSVWCAPAKQMYHWNTRIVFVLLTALIVFLMGNIYIYVYDDPLWWSYVIIVHDNHIYQIMIIRWTYMMIVYNDHVWRSCMMIVGDYHVWWSEVMVTWSYMIIIYGNHIKLWSFDEHIWWSYKMIIYDDHVWWS
jgi:hypothetical protein